MYEKDSKKMSALYGRIAAGALMILSVVLGQMGLEEVTPADQQELINAGQSVINTGYLFASAISGGFGTFLAWFSKYREGKKEEKVIV